VIKAQDFRTITLETAIRAVKAYNSGSYRGRKNVNLDLQVRQSFAAGLAPTLEGIIAQVRLIGEDYGGVAGFPKALTLAPDVAAEIHRDRKSYTALITAAPPLMQAHSSVDTVTHLLQPFTRPLYGKRNWHVWASKFLHFLNPDAFPILDSRVARFFGLWGSNSAAKYVELLRRFRTFAITHQSWLESLRIADGGHAWSDTKLWDKVCYGVKELGDKNCAA
jgi:hypothetical protein